MLNEVSLYNRVRSEIGSFLQEIGLCCDTVELNRELCEGLVDVVDMLSDYYEEGSHLYPSIVLFDDPQYLKIVPNKHFKFYKGDIRSKQIKLCLKMCAPLAVNGWDIFLQVSGSSMSWGMITGELRETSLTLPHQVLKDKEPICKVAIISNIGMKSVALVSSGCECHSIIHLSLTNNEKLSFSDITNFFKCALEKCTIESEEFRGYFKKVVKKALQTGHGNLFGVIEEGEHIPDLLKEGVDLTTSPIDFALTYDAIISETDPNSKVELNTELKMMSSLAVSMMNHDGITIFTNTGKIVGYHFIVDNKVIADDVIIGGARTKAFFAMVQSHKFKGVFMRKQEGDTKFE